MAKLAYIKVPGVIGLSYSKEKTLNSCPRKFLLSEHYERTFREGTVDTEFGHSFAAGVQEFFRSGNIELAKVCAMAAWDMSDLWATKKYGPKRFEEVLLALDKFVGVVYPQYFEGRWKLADLGNLPAIELLGYIDIFGKFSYQLHIDLILESIETGMLATFEIKTTEKDVQPAMYSNSEQALRYSLIVDDIATRLGKELYYGVHYLVYNPKQEDNMGFTIFDFPKSSDIKLEAINSLLMQVSRLQTYLDHNYWPKDGDSCLNWNRPCEHYGICDLKVSQEQSFSNSVYEALSPEDANVIVSIETLLSKYSAQTYGNHIDHRGL